MQGANKKRPVDVRQFKRPPDPKSAPHVSQTVSKVNDKNRQQSSALGNPSKRHRERLNTELDAVAALLPFENGILSRLDKLSVLRLAVAYLEGKTFFQVLQQRHYMRWPFCGGYSSAFLNPRHYAQEQTVLKALGGFLLVLNENGHIIYATENIETLLGFHQSDTLHQPIFDMIHSEDRDELRRILCWNYCPIPHDSGSDFILPAADSQILMERQVSVRFRCFLDNTCGFMRVDIRGRLVILEGCLPHCYVASRPEPNYPIFGLIAVCIPLVMPSHVDTSPEEPFLRSKHSLNFTFCSADIKFIHALEIADDCQLSQYSLYTFADSRDLALVAEAHKQVIQNGAAGLLVYRLISKKTQKTYWLQSSCRLMMKNAKPDSIACSHRLLTEYEGSVLLSKRSSLAAKVLVLEDNMSNSSTSMSLFYNSSMPQPNLHPLGSAAIMAPNFQSTHQHMAPPVPSHPVPYSTKPSVRFRSSGKRVRLSSMKNQIQQPVVTGNGQSQEIGESSSSSVPTYLLYPQSGGSGLQYYAEANNEDVTYAQQTSNYTHESVNELQVHYHLHQHYSSPTTYYSNAHDESILKQSISPGCVQQDQQTYRMQHIDHGATPVWIYANQAQPTPSIPTIDNRSKSVFSIQEVTNTLLSQ